MKFDEQFAERVALHRAGYGITQVQLAEKVGVTPRQIAAYEGGQSKPRPAVLMRMAKVFGVSPEFLSNGNGLYEDQSYKGLKVKTVDVPGASSDVIVRGGVPLIGIENVANWLDGSRHDGVKVLSRYHSHLHVSSLAFALNIDEPAMAYSDSFGYGIPRRSIVLFDPSLDAEDQDFVLALMPNGGVLFRQFFSGYRGGMLHALDERYPPENLHDHEDEDGNVPTLIPAISYEAYLPSSDRLQESYIYKPT